MSLLVGAADTPEECPYRDIRRFVQVLRGSPRRIAPCDDRVLQLIQRVLGLIGLRLVGDGTDLFAVYSKLGQITE